MRVSLNQDKLYVDEKTTDFSGNQFVKVVAGDLFLDPMNYQADPAPSLLHHVTVTLNHIGGGFHQLTTFVNGTGFPHLVQSAYFKADNGEMYHNWDDNGFLEFGHQFRSDASDFKLFQFAMYDRPLSAAEVEQNYNAGPPDSAPVIEAVNQAVPGEECVQIDLVSDDFDVDMYASWTSFNFPGMLTPKTVDVSSQLFYVSQLPPNGGLYTDISCTNSISATAQSGDSDLAGKEIPSSIFYKSNVAFGGDDSFYVWAKDGATDGGETKIELSVTAPPTNYCSSYNYFSTYSFSNWYWFN